VVAAEKDRSDRTILELFILEYPVPIQGIAMSLTAYQQARAYSETPRTMEYRLISEITSEMVRARDAGLAGAALMPTLHRNRELWTTFSALCVHDGNQLPPETRAGIISLALWVERTTSDVIRGHETADDLIRINRSIMEGLVMQKPSLEMQAN
jgi:flagellar protein FlaF